MNWHTRRYNDDFHDHRRDERKHEPRPTDPQMPSVLAIEVALAVRHPELKLTQAAQLIEDYARAERARISLEAVAAGANA